MERNEEELPVDTSTSPRTRQSYNSSRSVNMLLGLSSTKSPNFGFGPRSHFSSQSNLDNSQPSYSASPSRIRNQTIALSNADRRKDSPPGELSSAGQSNLSLLLRKTPSPPQTISEETTTADEAQNSIPQINFTTGVSDDSQNNVEPSDPRNESRPLLNSSTTYAYNYGNLIPPDDFMSIEDRSFVEKVYDWLPCTSTNDPRERRRPNFIFTPENILQQVILNPISYIPAVILGLLLNLLDAISYGMITFPLNNPTFQSFGPDGISMFFVSCIVSQVVYSGGGSIFGGGNGSMMIEVVPFLHIMAAIITQTCKDDNQGDDYIIATTMLSFALSSVLTGLAFLLMGALKLGSLIEFFPRHILVGCIGGVGWFLFATAIEVSASLEGNLGFSLGTLKTLFLEGHNLALWGSALGLAIILRIIQSKVHHSLVVPIYFMVVPLLFYFIIYIFNFSWEHLRQERWVFGLPEKDAPWNEYLTRFDFTKINFVALIQTVPAMLALTFFGILHVPINVPALGVSLNEDNVDTDRELVAHGLSNILSGLCGSVQNYLVYTNSVLFIKSGGDSRVAGLMLAAGTAIILFVGPWIVGYIPVMVVGALIFHLGLDLLKEALIDTWGIVNRMEYFTIVAIVIAMASLGFIEGIFLGIIMACIFFVVSNSRKSAIRATFSGSSVSSTVRRRYRQQKFLKFVGSQIYAIKLQGYLFFGTINGVEKEIRRILTYSEWRRNPIRFLILDLNLVNGLDFSAAEAFFRIQRLLQVKHVYLVFCGATYNSEVGKALRAIGMWRDEPSNNFLLFYENFNEALEQCENLLLQAYYERASRQLITNQDAIQPIQNGVPESALDISSPRNNNIMKVGMDVLKAKPSTKKNIRPTSILMNAFEDMTDKKEDYLENFFTQLAPYFHETPVPTGVILWFQGDAPDCLYLVERGILRATWRATEDDPSRPVESILPGTLAGEIGFFTGRKRDATLVADSDCILWKMRNEDFASLLEKDPNTANAFMRLALNFSAERLISMTYYAFHLSQ
ncbi:sulfate transporter family-domain-containing protein [Gigaspora margarita]|uniref:Sulfate transporter family-domain-containing protein n=1 Tax=Gigaspora margarita TaxID=4874 RepID=A0A8H4EIP0_GIGMA|nr:sulfate transporter family-domain-containing protein [Gigaspora margarita]